MHLMQADRAALIRQLQEDDDLVAITDLIHEAYAPHLESGLRFWGTHQTVEDTAARFAQGHPFLCIADGRYVGTVTVRPPQPESTVSTYRDSRTWSISQFAVAPAKKGYGLGKMLHDSAIEHARYNGAAKMALDTAAPALGLIKMYLSWGYEVSGECDWRPHTNYLSVLMVRSLT